MTKRITTRMRKRHRSNIDLMVIVWKLVGDPPQDTINRWLADMKFNTFEMEYLRQLLKAETPEACREVMLRT